MNHQYKDVFDFQEKHPTKEEREEVLATLSDEEIWHIAKSCGTAQGKLYYSRFLKHPENIKE